MAAGMSTPMLDFFRRGEVARDVRMLAAQVAIAPRHLEQLGILRSCLIRDPNRMVAAAVLSCPKVNDGDVEACAKLGNVSEDILRIDRDEPGADEELRRAARAGQEFQDARRAHDEHAAASQRVGREEALDRPERA